MSFAPFVIRSRQPKVGTTIFTVMSALAQQQKAINLSQGFPDFAAPEALLEAVERHMRSGHNQYAPMAGVLPLREAIAAKVSLLYGVDFDPDTEITVTAGATQAIFGAIAALVGPGDEAIVFEPVYDSYIPAIELNGGRAIAIPLTQPDYRIDWPRLTAAISPKTRVIVINSPHNPTGSLLTAGDLAQLAALIAHTDIVILSDEVYEHMVFDEARHTSVCTVPGLAERSFVVSSFGKTYHVTGWKVAYCLAPKALMTEFRKAHQFIVFTVNTPMQYALAEFMHQTDWYQDLRALYQERRDFFRRLLQSTPFELLPCQGTYFQCVRYHSPESDVEFVKRLTTQIKVAAIPVSAFYGNGFDAHVIRFCFAKTTDTLQAAAERLMRV